MSIKGKRILVVEDEALIALDTISALEDAGYEVVGPAARVEAGLRLIAEGGLDGAVLDVNLNGIYVWPVAHALVAKGVPFVFVTGYGTVLDYPAACAAVPRLGKPLDHKKLLKALGDVFAAGKAHI